MDAFNLHWPGGEATLHTDGTRCRVVWRAENGMGGTIDNSDLAKRRVAGGLAFAPSLLDELRAKGHVTLADELTSLDDAAPKAAPAKPAAANKREEAAPVERAEATPTGRVDAWLAALDGNSGFESCGTRRAMKWHRGKTWPASLSLKPPGKTGAKEWVVKLADGKTQYFAATDFAGVCACLASMDVFATPEFFDAFFEGCKALRHKEVATAREAWLATA